MIDFHSHILPGVDDGAKDVNESLELLEALGRQGVGTVIATPHFNAKRESPDEFILRRNAAVAAIAPRLTKSMPHILCGAEVMYYPGIGKMKDLAKLRIEGSKLLLLEMPMATWTAYIVEELIRMSGYGGTVVVIAHMERYMGLQSASVISRLYEVGILMQFNAEFFTGLFGRRKAFSMLRFGDVHFIGSDCHNMTQRPPQIGKAYAMIEKNSGRNFFPD